MSILFHARSQESSTITNNLSTSHYIPKEEPEFSELRIYDFIIDLYYGNSAIVKLFKATAISAIIYYVSNKIISKLSEIMNGYQDQLYSVNRDVSSLVTEMGAMMQEEGFFIDSPPQRFINIYDQEIADRVYKSMIECEGMDDKIPISLNGRNLRKSKVLEAGLMLGYSNLYIYYGIHSVLSYFSKISIGGYLSYEALKSKLYYTRKISEVDCIDYCKVLADMEDKNAGQFLAAIDVVKMDTMKRIYQQLCQQQQKNEENDLKLAYLARKLQTDPSSYEENYSKLLDMMGKLKTDALIIGDKICNAYTDML
jgi:hypothetical protein